MKLTTASIRTLSIPAGKSEAIYFDDDVPGFGIRIRDGGSRGYVFQYKLGTKQRRIALGPLSAIDLSKARDNAKDLYAKVRLGQDPAGEKAEAKAKAGRTFDTAIEDYLTIKKKSYAAQTFLDAARHLRTDAKTLHRLNVEKISRADIAGVLSTVRNNSGEVTGNRVRATLSGFFSWAMGEGMCDANPVVGTNRAEEKPRKRVLTPAELRIIWQALPDDHYGAILKLLALTGQRASEVADLRWSEIKGKTILLPEERTKNGRAHSVPLSNKASTIIGEQKERADRDLIFGDGEGGFSGWSKCKERLDAAIKEQVGKALPHWTPHDFRRSFATHAAEIGIQPHIIEAVLNHVSGHKAGVAGIYNHATYEPEKRAALDRWAEQLLAWVEGRESKVTALRRA